MADVITWGKQLQEQLQDEAEWQVVSARISIVTKAPDGKVGIHELDYKGKEK
jgi:hypothetical protein